MTQPFEECLTCTTNSQLKRYPGIKQTLLTCPLEHPSAGLETFHRWDAI